MSILEEDRFFVLPGHYGETKIFGWLVTNKNNPGLATVAVGNRTSWLM